ncbi:MAG: isovaleryl-CoA dehydrogenase [Candidatus Binatia bacterium]
MATHEVSNQPPPLRDYNLFESDRALCEGLEREGAGWAAARVSELGAIAGGEAMEWGRQANAHPPVLRTHDRYGHRIDEIEYHPAYHRLMELAVGYGLHALPWREPRAGAQVARAALFFVLGQAEAGHGCPISMTYAAVPALRTEPELAHSWEPLFTSSSYDPRFVPVGEKAGALCGMAMTEKQGGSDVRANTTRAEPAGNGGWVLTGHKWFCSAPMCDAFLVLAQTGKGLTCFLLPRWQPDGRRNHFFIQRLKDKLGNRSNASGEVEFDGAWAQRVGPEGRGVPTIIEMVNHTRLDCIIGAAGLMRHGVAQAVHHAQHRSAFGKRLIEQPLMQNVLADLCIESEAATTAMMRVARAYDANGDEGEAHFARLATTVLKYWICKRAPAHAAEALECLGGGGYIEESPLPRLYREAPLNSLWEGSGNVICLDAIRAIAKSPAVLEAFFAEVERGSGADRRLDQFTTDLREDLARDEPREARARDLVERLALALQGSLLVRHGDPAVAEAFCAARLGGHHRLAFGTLAPGFHFPRVIERARPSV